MKPLSRLSLSELAERRYRGRSAFGLAVGALVALHGLLWLIAWILRT